MYENGTSNRINFLPVIRGKTCDIRFRRKNDDWFLEKQEAVSKQKGAASLF
jgi:hypothetical protein